MLFVVWFFSRHVDVKGLAEIQFCLVSVVITLGDKYMYISDRMLVYLYLLPNK